MDVGGGGTGKLGGEGGSRGLVGGLGVTLMEHHFTFKWWEADNQSDVAAKFKISQVSTLSSNINNTIQHLTADNNVLQSVTKVHEHIKLVRSNGRISNSFGK